MATDFDRANNEYVGRVTTPEWDADYTIHFRVRFKTVASRQTLFIANAGTPGQAQEWVTLEGSNNLRLRRINDDGSGNITSADGGTTIVTGVDYDVFVVRTGTTWNMYLNNNAATEISTVAATAIAASTQLAFASEFGIGNSLDGSLSDLAIWTEALSQTNRDLVTAGSASAYTTNQWGRWKLDVHTALSDLSGNSRDVTATGTLATITDPVVPSGGGGATPPKQPTMRGRSMRQRRRPVAEARRRRRRGVVVRAPRRVSTTYTHTMSGGVQSSGAGVTALKKVTVAVGGLQSGGTSTVKVSKVLVAAGGLSSGGIASSSIKYVPRPVGGLNAAGDASTSFTPGGSARRPRIQVAHRRARQHRPDPSLSPARHRLIYIPTIGAAPSSTTYTHTMTGGLASGGAGIVRIAYKARTPTGGLQSGGAAIATKFQQHIATGGLQSGGAATFKLTKVVIPIGGIQSAGVAASFLKKVVIATGGLNSGGVVLAKFFRQHVATGGLSSGGIAPSFIRYVPRPAGGLQSGGAASVSFLGTFSYVMVGGMQTGGAAVIWRKHAARLPTGGFVAGGSVPAVKRYGFFASGGLSSAGAAVVRATKTMVATGGLHAGGAATSIYIFGGTIPAAFSGRVFIFPRFDGRVVIDPE